MPPERVPVSSCCTAVEPRWTRPASMKN
jgi:hypothetical protein